jgi:hypothetical protein
MSCRKSLVPDEGDESIKALRRDIFSVIDEKGDGASVFLYDLPIDELLVSGLSIRTRIPEEKFKDIPFHYLRQAFERTSQPIDPTLPTRKLQGRHYISPGVFGVALGGALYFNMLWPAFFSACFMATALYNIHAVRSLNRQTDQRNRKIGEELLSAQSSTRKHSCEAPMCQSCTPA